MLVDIDHCVLCSAAAAAAAIAAAAVALLVKNGLCATSLGQRQQTCTPSLLEYAHAHAPVKRRVTSPGTPTMCIQLLDDSLADQRPLLI